MSNPLGVCRWQIVTLLELLEASAEAYWRMSGLIGQFIVKLEMAKLTGGQPLDSAIHAMGQMIVELQHETKRLRLRSPEQQLNRIIEYTANATADTKITELRQMLIELQQRMVDELTGRCFLMVPVERIEFYKQGRPLFGSEVAAAFPLAAEDIAEAGKCLALGRATASVFHQMRAMECVVQRLSITLGITNTEREWGKLLSDITAKIEAMPKGQVRNAWSESRSHLYHVKQAWRNDTMHPKQTYTVEEAQTILEAVKVFMRDLAALV